MYSSLPLSPMSAHVVFSKNGVRWYTHTQKFHTTSVGIATSIHNRSLIIRSKAVSQLILAVCSTRGTCDTFLEIKFGFWIGCTTKTKTNLWPFRTCCIIAYWHKHNKLKCKRRPKEWIHVVIDKVHRIDIS